MPNLKNDPMQIHQHGTIFFLLLYQNNLHHIPKIQQIKDILSSEHNTKYKLPCPYLYENCLALDQPNTGYPLLFYNFETLKIVTPSNREPNSQIEYAKQLDVVA